MKKMRDVPISVNDIKEYLATQDDFALELYVYNQARSLGFYATHGGTYEDPVTKKSRQYDIRAFIENNNRRIDLAIECKSLQPSFPLLISRIPRIAEESFHHVIFSFKREEDSFSPSHILPSSKLAAIRSPLSIYPEDEHVGKSTSQIGRNENGDLGSGDGKVFDKWFQALASADELISDATQHYKKFDNKKCITIVIPLLVVSDGTLWVADYANDGALMFEPKQVDEALLFVGREYSRLSLSPYTVSHLHIFTKSGVLAFFRKLAVENGIWDEIFPMSEIKRLVT